jgi:hypothetical protein
MNELSMQDKGVRTTTTLVDSYFANRSHSQGIVVEENELMKVRTKRIIASEELVKLMWNFLKFRKRDFALIATHAKLGINVRGDRKGFSSPMKGMAKGTLNVHLSKAMNLPSRIKGLTSNRKM